MVLDSRGKKKRLTQSFDNRIPPRENVLICSEIWSHAKHLLYIGIWEAAPQHRPALHRAGECWSNHTNEIKSPSFCFTLSVVWKWSLGVLEVSGGSVETLVLIHSSLFKKEGFRGSEGLQPRHFDPQMTMKSKDAAANISASLPASFLFFLSSCLLQELSNTGWEAFWDSNICQWLHNKQSFTIRGLHWRDNQPPKGFLSTLECLRRPFWARWRQLPACPSVSGYNGRCTETLIHL